MGSIGYNLENTVGCSEFPLPVLKPVVLQETEHHGGLPQAEQQAGENCLIICKKSTASFRAGLVLMVIFMG